MSLTSRYTIGVSPFKHTTDGENPAHDDLFKNNKEQHRAAHGLATDTESESIDLLSPFRPILPEQPPGVDNIYDLELKERQLSMQPPKEDQKSIEGDQLYYDKDIDKYRKPFIDYLPETSKGDKLKVDGVSPFSHTGANKENRTEGEETFKTWLVDNALENYEYTNWWDVETSRLWSFYKDKFFQSKEFLKLDSTIKTPFIIKTVPHKVTIGKINLFHKIELLVLMLVVDV